MNFDWPSLSEFVSHIESLDKFPVSSSLDLVVFDLTNKTNGLETNGLETKGLNGVYECLVTIKPEEFTTTRTSNLWTFELPTGIYSRMDAIHVTPSPKYWLINNYNHHRYRNWWIPSCVIFWHRICVAAAVQPTSPVQFKAYSYRNPYVRKCMHDSRTRCVANGDIIAEGMVVVHNVPWHKPLFRWMYTIATLKRRVHHIISKKRAILCIQRRWRAHAYRCDTGVMYRLVKRHFEFHSSKK